MSRNSQQTFFERVFGTECATTTSSGFRLTVFSLVMVCVMTVAGVALGGLPTITETQKRGAAVADYRLGTNLAVWGDHCTAQSLSGFLWLYRSPLGWASQANALLSGGSVLAIDMDGDEVAYANTGARAPLFYPPQVWEWGNTTYPDGAGPVSLPGVAGDAEDIAIRNGLVAVGRPEAGDPGVVDLYLDDSVNGWEHMQTVSIGSSAGLRFGASVAVGYPQGELIVGMPRSSPSDYGLVYHFKLIDGTWTFYDFFASPQTPAGDQFGAAIAFSDPYLVVGAPNTTTVNATQEGAVYVYKLVSGTFQYLTTLYGAGVDNDHFGASVAVNSRYLVVGAPDEDRDALPFPYASVGAAYLWKWDAGVLGPVARLHASDGWVLDYFGSSVAVTEKGAVVGAPFADNGGNLDTGSIYFFEPMFSDGFESGNTGAWSQ